MTTEEAIIETRAVPLVAVETIGKEVRTHNVYLHMVTNADGEEEPIRLGTGRSAVVFLATDLTKLIRRAKYRAVKFLRDDPDDHMAYAAAMRFFQEAVSLQTKSDNIASLVEFLGWGAIDRDLKRREPVNSIKEFWWDQYPNFDKIPGVSFESNQNEAFRLIKNRYGLQGPFYCMELCHGTLEHLLERSDRWFDLPVYHYNTGSADALRRNARELSEDLDAFIQRYLRNPQNDQPLTRADLSRMSGYDILNAFRRDEIDILDSNGQPLRDDKGPIKHDPNLIRTHTVLKLFSEIVQSLQPLHRHEEAHRDLKPGNIFFSHSHDAHMRVEVKLADLGYVTNTEVIHGGETLKGGNEQAPGSPFYRAPEQADLPIEVRITIDEIKPERVIGKGSKISSIQPSDWLYIADLFDESSGYHPDAPEDENTAQREDRAKQAKKLRSEYRDRRYYRVEASNLDERTGAFTLDLESPVISQERDDLQAQISKSTGFHTDIYSLGAILYDLVSGGRNPEHFYTYCLKVFTNQFGVNSNLIPRSVDEVLEILAPENRNQPRDLQNRWHLARLVLTTKDVDGLIKEILRQSYVNATEVESQKQIRDYRFRSFDVVNTLLQDKRGEPIPREIVRIIVRCMLRDKINSFCNSEKGWSAFVDGSNDRTIVKELEDEIDDLLGGKFRLPQRYFPDRLQDDLLFRLRTLTFNPDELPGSGVDHTAYSDATNEVAVNRHGADDRSEDSEARHDQTVNEEIDGE